MYFVRIFSHIISCFINTIQVNTSRSLLQYKVVCFINFVLSGNTQIKQSNLIPNKETFLNDTLPLLKNQEMINYMYCEKTLYKMPMCKL